MEHQLNYNSIIKTRMDIQEELVDNRQVKIEVKPDQNPPARRKRKMSQKALDALAKARAKKAEKMPKKRKMREARQVFVSKVSKQFEQDYMADKDMSRYDNYFREDRDMAGMNTPASDEHPTDRKKEEAEGVSHASLIAEPVSFDKTWSGKQQDAVGPATTSAQPGSTPSIDDRDAIIQKMRRDMERLNREVEYYNSDAFSMANSRYDTIVFL